MGAGTDGPAAPPPVAPRPPARLRVRTEHRQGWLKAGAWLTAVGIVLAIAGGATLWLVQTAAVVLAGDRAQIGNPVSFDAKDARYQLILINDPTSMVEWEVTDVTCAVRRSDETTTTLSGARQLTRIQTSVGIQIATFDATPGPTSARCTFIDGGSTFGFFYAVGRAHEHASAVSMIGLVIGVVLILIGAYALTVGFRGRAVIERPAPPPTKT